MKNSNLSRSVKILALIGPTSSGKTELGVDLAKQWNGAIVTCDSRQIWTDADIGVGKIHGQETLMGRHRGRIDNDGIFHGMISLRSPNRDFSVAEFQIEAFELVDDLLKKGTLPLLVGGTGLYLSSIIDHWDLPSAKPDPTLRSKLEQESMTALCDRLLRLDPDAQAIVTTKNPRRIIRALEVCLTTGHAFTKQQKKGMPRYEVLQIGLHIERQELHRRIQERVKQMIKEGWVDEVRHLTQQYGSAALSKCGIGYLELAAHLRGETSLTDALALIELRTRQYARRQMTWFRRDKRIHWISDPAEALPLIRDFLEH